MVATRVKTYLDIINAVLRRAQQPNTDTTTSNTVREAVKGFINDRLYEVYSRQNWRWRREERNLKIIAKYTTGTVAVTNDSRQITFSTSIDSTFLYRKIYVGTDNEHYRIIAVDTAANTAMLDANYLGTTNAAATFTVYKDEYGLWPDFENIVDTSNLYRRTHIRRTSPRMVNEMGNKFPTREGKTQLITIDGKQRYDGVPMGPMVMGYDFMGVPESKQLKIWPRIPDQDRLIPITYVKRPVPLDVNTDEPLMPEDDRIVLMYGALADTFELLKDETSTARFEAKYSQKLAEMEAENQETDDQFQLEYDSPYYRDIGERSPLKDDLGELFDIS